MKIEVRELMDSNEMLSHIFLGCIPKEKLVEIRDKYISKTDWKKESVKIPVEMKIGGVSVNPKSFFDSWLNQMQAIVLKKAKELYSEKSGSEKMRNIQSKISEIEQVLEHFESEINWQVDNPLLEIESDTKK